MKPDTRDFAADVVALEPELVQWRRQIHQNPELSFQETQTSALICAELDTFEGVTYTRPTPTSVMAVVRGKKPGRTIAIRADIDALPIDEQTDVPFRSVRKGVMHACGHDGHAAILLATAKVIGAMQDQLSGEVRFLFQHAEELPPGGAAEMVAAGVMEGVDEVYGLHLSSAYDTCTFGLRSGALTAATDRFDITVIGKGGHSAFPETTVDPIVVGTQVVSALQTIVSRQTSALDSLVVSVCQVSAGDAYNIIPGTMKITGSTRSFSREVRAALPNKIEKLVRGVTDAYGADYDFQFSHGYASVFNDDALTSRVEALITTHFGADRVAHIMPVMPGEDFSAFSEQCPGCFVELGTRNAEKQCDVQHHNALYKMDEDALLYGVEFFRTLILDRLGE